MGKETQLPLSSREIRLSRRNLFKLGTGIALGTFANIAERGGRFEQQAFAAEAVKGGINALGALETSAEWYFAEGYTGPGFFQEDIVILNPSDNKSQIMVTYQRQSGLPPLSRVLEVSPRSRFTLPVNHGFYGVGPNEEVSAKIESTNGVGIVAERTMYFVYDHKIKGAHTSIGARSPHRNWYFAEGYTGPGFDEYLTIQNPDPRTAQLRVTYFLGEGRKPVHKEVEVEGNSRHTIVVHDTKEGVGRDQEVSARVESTNGVNVVVERPMYFDYMGNVKDGHIVMGANSPSTEWLFAEGYTGKGFDEYLTIMNPEERDAEIKVTYFLANGEPQVKIIKVPAASRHTITVHDTKEGVGRNQEVSAKIESTNGVGIVAERPMYFDYNGRIKGGHNGMGATRSATRWYFPEGETTQGFDTYLTVMNSNEKDVRTKVRYFSPGGMLAEKDIVISANSRATIPVHDSVRGGVIRGQSVGSEVSVDSDLPIVVERPMYFDRSGGLTPPTDMLNLPKRWRWGQKATLKLVMPAYAQWEVFLIPSCPLNLTSGFTFRGDKLNLTNQTVGKSEPGQTCSITVVARRLGDQKNIPVFFETKQTTITS